MEQRPYFTKLKQHAKRRSYQFKERGLNETFYTDTLIVKRKSPSMRKYLYSQVY